MGVHENFFFFTFMTDRLTWANIEEGETESGFEAPTSVHNLGHPYINFKYLFMDQTFNILL